MQVAHAGSHYPSLLRSTLHLRDTLVLWRTLNIPHFGSGHYFTITLSLDLARSLNIRHLGASITLSLALPYHCPAEDSKHTFGIATAPGEVSKHMQVKQ